VGNREMPVRSAGGYPGREKQLCHRLQFNIINLHMDGYMLHVAAFGNNCSVTLVFLMTESHQ
jgi:hypothetical protein